MKVRSGVAWGGVRESEKDRERQRVTGGVGDRQKQITRVTVRPNEKALLDKQVSSFTGSQEAYQGTLDNSQSTSCSCHFILLKRFKRHWHRPDPVHNVS